MRSSRPSGRARTARRRRRAASPAREDGERELEARAPLELLGRPLEVSFTRDSGLAGLVFLVEQHTGRRPRKDDPDLRRVHEELMREFDAGRQTTAEWEEIAKRLGAPVA